MIQTLALVVGLLIALSNEAINQLPIASVCDAPRSLSMGACVSVMAKSAKKGYRITGLHRMAGLLGAVACVMARCCVHVVFVIQLSRSS